MAAPLKERLKVDRIVRAAQRRARARFYPDGGPEDQWCRIVMNERIDAHLRTLPVASMHAIEISGSTHAHRGWKDFTASTYPALDVCAPPPDVEQHDVVLCEQVLEHVPDPWRAARTLFDLCRPGGQLVVSTPFLIKVHPTPFDFWRFTEDGLRLLLEGAGFTVDEVGSWGSKAAVRGNLRRFAPMARWRPLRNEAEFPLVVWAFGHRPA